MVQTDAGQQDSGDISLAVRHGVAEGEDWGLQGYADEVLPYGEGFAGQDFPEVPGMGEVGGGRGAARGDEVALRVDEVQSSVKRVDAEHAREKALAGLNVRAPDFREFGQVFQQVFGGRGGFGLLQGDVPGEGEQFILYPGHGLVAVVQGAEQDDEKGGQGREEEEHGELLAYGTMEEACEHACFRERTLRTSGVRDRFLGSTRPARAEKLPTFTTNYAIKKTYWPQARTRRIRYSANLHKIRTDMAGQGPGPKASGMLWPVFR